jgi:hypothetical protein
VVRKVIDSTIFRVHEVGSAQFSIVMRPRGADWLADDIARLKAKGIGLLVSMLTPDEQDELGLLAEADSSAACEIEYLSLPIPDLGVPADLTAFEATIRKVKHALSAGRSVGVHCRQSIGRSGLFACAVLIATGVPLEQALTTASRGARLVSARDFGSTRMAREERGEIPAARRNGER